MRKLFGFLMVSVAFTGLQVMTAGAAENCVNAGTPTEVAACWDRQAPAAATRANTDTAVRAHQ
jgi:3-hydroxyisobutyrate dehydrogenase-like beta-hydroxyacid dehydrogenase